MTQIIDQLPLPVPSRTDPTNFSVRADNFLGELPDFATQVNALATELTALGNTVEANKNTAVTAANNAQASAFAATGSANNAATSSGAALWVSGTTYSVGNLVYSPITGRTYRRKIAGAGTTDPSADATNWIPIVLEISTQYPTIRPSLNLDFVNNKYLDPRITFTRSTIAKYYDGKTVHKAEENLFIRSEEFDNVAWAKSAITTTTNTTVDPFGTSTADTITETSGTAWHGLSAYEYVSTVAGESYTLSVYAKYNTRQFLQLALGSGGFNTTYYANFDVQNGTVGTVGSGVTAGIVSVGNGWYRCSITGVALTSSTTAGANIIMANSSSLAYAASYAGSTSNSVYIFGAQVEQRNFVGPYQATTTQPITNYQSTLVTASINQPRFDHDPVTKECKGLFIEDATTNLLTYSEDFGNAAWNKNATTVSGDFTIAPDGTKSADKLVETTATDLHYVSSSSQVFTSGVTYTFSVYAKASTRDVLQIVPPAGAFPVAFANFNLTTGTIGSQSGALSVSIISVGNGWYRCSLTLSAISSTSSPVFFLLQPSDTSPRADAYTGDGYSGIYIWGAQLEDASASPSSYVATAGATASRNYDSAYMTGNNFSSWYNQDGGTVYSEFRMDQKPLVSYFNNFVWNINEPSNSNLIAGSVDATGYLRTQSYFNGSLVALNASATPWVNNTLYRIGFSFTQDNFNTSYNSSNIISDTSGTLFKNMTSLYLGCQVIGSSLLRGHLRRFTYYPKVLTNQELQTLTAI